MKLLPKNALIQTGEVDHADWNHRPLLGSIIRSRYDLVLSLLPSQGVGRLLEVGYGSGVFMPELAMHCRELSGIDVHPNATSVTQVLADFGVRADLTRASATELPYANDWFDCIVVVSALEFVDDIDMACREMLRVLHPKGTVVVVTPASSPITDLGLKILTGQRAKDDFGQRRERVEPALRRNFDVIRVSTIPKLSCSPVLLYRGFELRRADRGEGD